MRWLKSSRFQPERKGEVLLDYVFDSDLLTPDEELACEAMIARHQAEALRSEGDAVAARAVENAFWRWQIISGGPLIAAVLHRLVDESGERQKDR